MTLDEWIQLWWVIVRRSMGVPDILSEVNGDRAVAHRMISSLGIDVSPDERIEVEAQAARVARAVSKAGARGGLDQMLCQFNWEPDPVEYAMAVAIGAVRREAESDEDEDDQFIRHAVNKVATYVFEHPFTDGMQRPFA